MSARIQFTNHLLSSGSVQGSDPLLTGGSGRLWATSDGKLRIELQSDSGRGDSEIVVNGRRFLVYSGDSGTAYRGTLPRESGKPSDAHRGAADAPSLAQIRRELGAVSKHLAVSTGDADRRRRATRVQRSRVPEEPRRARRRRTAGLGRGPRHAAGRRGVCPR